MMTKTKRGSHRFYHLEDGTPTPKDNRPIAGIALDRKAKGYVIAPGSVLGGFSYSPVAFWDTPISELPAYPKELFPPDIQVERCSVVIPDTPLAPHGAAIIQWFLDNSDDSVQGQAGSSQLKRAASFFRNGLSLSLEDTERYMGIWNGLKAKPAWSQREIQHAIETSSREGAANGRPRGWAYADWVK